MINLVTKEQRRGVRADMVGLRDLVLAQPDWTLTKGTAAMHFGWAHSKVYTMFRQADEIFQDIARVRGSLMFLGPYPEENEEA